MLKVCHGARARALRTLTFAQLGTFPDLAEIAQDRTSRMLAETLADRLARLTLAGHLHAREPGIAAEQLLALLTGPLEARTRLGTRKTTNAELTAIADAAVDTFLAAYAPR